MEKKKASLTPLRSLHLPSDRSLHLKHLRHALLLLLAVNLESSAVPPLKESSKKKEKKRESKMDKHALFLK